MNQTQMDEKAEGNSSRSGSPSAYASASQRDEARVLKAVEEYCTAVQAGHKPTREEFLARHAEIAGPLAKCLDGLEFVYTAGTGLSQFGTGEPATAADDVQPSAPLGDYQIVREIGRGGMGVVYEAVQLSLGRRVALKVLPFAAALDAKQLQRFKNEAQAAAHLHHTNIVPVISVGCERGVHYYAMQYIEGQTLAAVIAELRQQAGLERQDASQPLSEVAKELVSGRLAPAKPCGSEPPTGPYHGTTSPPHHPTTSLRPDPTPPVAGLSTEHSIKSAAYFRTVANLGLQAAEALEHAHQMGVVHRDIKPANLLVDVRGNLWITDFGLAHCQSQPGLTMSGDLVGTLRYMSPEQALAKRVVVDHRTDIYSLGVTLYELLTLELAFRGSDRQELLRQIAFEEPRPPRRLNKPIPAELETIVLKAMEKNPAERYATAQELAEDLRRFLEDKPIKAKRPTLLQQAVRWGRRHRPVVGAAVVVLILASVALAASTWLIWREKEQTKAALAQAEGNFQKARQAVDQMLTRVAKEKLAHIPQMEKVRAELLQDALVFYQGFLQQQSTNPVVRYDMARAYRQVGYIQRLLGDTEKAQESSRQAILILEELASAFPDLPDYRAELAGSLRERGVWLFDLARNPEAEAVIGQALALTQRLEADFPEKAEYRQMEAWCHRSWALPDPVTTARKALEIQVRLVADFPSEMKYRHDLAITYEKLAHYLQGSRPQEAEKARRQALELLEKLPADLLNEPDCQKALALSHTNLGVSLMGTDWLGAENSIRKALAILEKLAADFPSMWENRVWLAGNHNNLGNLLRWFGRLSEADSAHRRALAIYEKLADEFPQRVLYRQRLATSYETLGGILCDAGKFAEAENFIRKANAIRDKLVADFPNAPELRQELVKSYGNLRVPLRETNRLADAENALRQSVTILERLVAEFPKEPAYRLDLATSHMGLGQFLDRAGRLAEAENAFRMGVAVEEKLMANFPNDSNYQRTLARSFDTLGQLLRKRGRLDQAQATFQQGRLIWEQLLRATPDSSDDLHQLGGILGSMSDVAMDRRALEEARKLLEQAINHQKRALVLSRNPPPSYNEWLGIHCLTLAEVLQQLGQDPASRDQIRQLLREATQCSLHNAKAEGNLAQFLNNCPDPQFRDPQRALELAKKLTETHAHKGECWGTLGMARYRLGDWPGAVAALEKAQGLRSGGDTGEWFFLAMAYARLADIYRAGLYYLAAVQRMEKENPKDFDLRRFRAEAAALLGVPGHKD
jgi:serine/threonine protein kinase